MREGIGSLPEYFQQVLRAATHYREAAGKG